MALIVEDGTGLSTATSYATTAEADTYHDRLHAERWQEADDYKKEQALIWATRLLDQHLTWKGQRVTTTQALGWPRTNVPTRESDDTYPSTSVPTFVKYATAEFGRLLLEKDRPVDSELVRVNATSAGGRSRTMGLPDYRYKGVIPPSVRALVAHAVVTDAQVIRA